VGIEWRLYFLLELTKLAWEEHNLTQTVKYIAQAKQIATQANQPHFLVRTLFTSFSSGYCLALA
jgi:hypothetical protein